MTATKTEGDGFSAQERAAMKERAAELRAEGKKGAKKADGQEALLEAIAKMAPDDRALAERVHVAISANAPELEPKTWYGMPAWANAEGKVVVRVTWADLETPGRASAKVRRALPRTSAPPSPPEDDPSPGKRSRGKGGFP